MSTASSILHKGQFLAISAASGSVRLWHLMFCCMVLSHVMRGRPGCFLQCTGGEADRILLASALSSMHALCPKQTKSVRLDYCAVSLGCFVASCIIIPESRQIGVMPNSICAVKHIYPTCVLEIAQHSKLRCQHWEKQQQKLYCWMLILVYQ